MKLGGAHRTEGGDKLPRVRKGRAGTCSSRGATSLGCSRHSTLQSACRFPGESIRLAQGGHMLVSWPREGGASPLKVPPSWLGWWSDVPSGGSGSPTPPRSARGQVSGGRGGGRWDQRESRSESRPGPRGASGLRPRACPPRRLARPGKGSRTHTHRNPSPEPQEINKKSITRTALALCLSTASSTSNEPNNGGRATPLSSSGRASNSDRSHRGPTAQEAALWAGLWLRFEHKGSCVGFCVCFFSNKTNIFPSPRANENKASFFQTPLVPTPR